MTVDAGRDIESFCRAEHPRLVQAMTLYTGSPDLAFELTQEALARAHRDWSRVSGMDAPGAWVHRVAINLANSQWRRRRYERLAGERAATRPAVAPDQHSSLEDGAIEVRRALARLPPRQREAVVLRFLLDLSIDETARHMHCAAGTVRALTAQGIARLRDSPELMQFEEMPHD
jgi:RNA polymerase sigma-70 factor (ECF subfamily)